MPRHTDAGPLGDGFTGTEPPAPGVEREAASTTAATTEASGGPGTGGQPRQTVGGTRASHAWAALSAGMVLLVILLVFILQNLKSVRVNFLWATWSIPLAVDLLLATVLGGLVMFTVGAARIIQLRRMARRNGIHR